jgi:hypothetical protein
MAAAQPPPPKAKEPEVPEGISWAGLVGAALGFGPLSALAAELASSPDEDTSRALALVPGVMAAVYVPAAWASVARTRYRSVVLQASVVGSLVVAFGGALALGPVNLLVLAPATVLLWLATRGKRWGGGGE